MSEYINYPLLIENSMRIVVKKAMQSFDDHYRNGKSCNHHFYISFLTNSYGVVLSERMQKKYPHEITIVLQHQFEDLKIMEEYFMVKLSFAGVKESIKVPFSAITSFTDPSVEFALQFNEIYQDYSAKKETNIIKETLENPKDDLKDMPNNVIQIDRFQK